jgi:hypothetical protein
MLGFDNSGNKFGRIFTCRRRACGRRKPRFAGLRAFALRPRRPAGGAPCGAACLASQPLQSLAQVKPLSAVCFYGDALELFGNLKFPQAKYGLANFRLKIGNVLNLLL